MGAGQGPHGQGQHAGLVDHGRADVDVQEIGAGGYLLLGEGQDLARLQPLQLGRKLGLARGVDALADDAAGAVETEVNGPRTRGDRQAGPGLEGRARRGTVAAQGGQGFDVLGRGAAAAAQAGHAVGGQGGHRGGEGVRGKAEDRGAVDQLGQAGVGFDEHGRVAGREDGARNQDEFLGAGAAVGADEVHAHVLHGPCEDLGAGAGQADAALEGHADAHGQVADLARGHDHGTGLGQVELRLAQDQVDAASHEASDLLLENLDEPAEGNVAQRLDHLARGAHAAGHEDAFVHGLTRGAGHGLIDLEDVEARGKLVAGRAEGVGGHDTGAGQCVLGVDGGHDIRARHAELLGGLAGPESPSLQQAAHASIEDQYVSVLQGTAKIAHCTPRVTAVSVPV
ncbi:hypothetical protein DSECCO2_543460 [anaerobic digester metagenome]